MLNYHRGGHRHCPLQIPEICFRSTSTSHSVQYSYCNFQCFPGTFPPRRSWHRTQIAKNCLLRKHWWGIAVVYHYTRRKKYPRAINIEWSCLFSWQCVLKFEIATEGIGSQDGIICPSCIDFRVPALTVGTPGFRVLKTKIYA